MESQNSAGAPPAAGSAPLSDKQVSSGFGLRQKIGLILGPLAFVLVGLFSGLPTAASWTAATVLLMSIWWITEAFPLWLTACVPLIAFPVIGVGEWRFVALQYFEPLNFLFLGGMLIAACMQEWGLHRRIALGIIAKVGTSPRRIVLGVMLATAFITLWISNTAAAVMMFPIAMAIILRFEEQHGRHDPVQRRFGLAVMLGLAYAASIGGIGTKIGTGTNFVFLKNVKDVLGPRDIDFLTWLKVGMPVVLISIPVVWLYLVRVAAPLPAQDFPGARKAIDDARASQGRVQPGEWIALIAFLSVALLWIFRKPIAFSEGFTIPGWSQWVPFGLEDVLGRKLDTFPKPVQRLLSDPGDAIVAILIALPLLIIPAQTKPVKFALSPRAAAGVSWGLLVMLGGGFAMAYGIQESGLSKEIGSHLGGVGQMHPFAAMLLLCLIATTLTEVASNTATASILLPIIAASQEHFGAQTAALMFAVTLAASFGFMLPAGTPPNAVAYSSGYISAPQMARSGLVVDVMGTTLIAVVCYFLAPWALGIR
ncbi:MAG TPA: SLC13 family permease [Planctomycetota bacterium]|nr:SLC13 family permease [Planctomycetota bacterium]